MTDPDGANVLSPNAEVPETSGGDRLRMILLASSLAVVVLTAPFFLWSIGYWLPRRTDSTFPESSNVYFVRELARGRPLYPDPRPGPVHAANLYAPLSFVLPALGCRLAGGGEYAARLAGRLQSLAAFLAAVAMVFFYLRRRGEAWLAAGAAARSLRPTPRFYRGVPSPRTDCLAVVLALGGFLLVRERRTTPRLLAAGALFLMAAFTKQTILVAPAAITLWMLSRREERRWGLIFGIVFGASGLLLLGLLHWATGGLSTLNMITANAACPWAVRGGLDRVVIPGLGTISPLLLPALAAVVSAVCVRRFRPLHLYLVLSLSATLLMSLKWGSSRSYFFETTVVAALLFPQGITVIAGWARPLRLAAAALLLLALSTYLLKPVYWMAGWDPVYVPLVNRYAGRIRFGEYPELHRRAIAAQGAIFVTDPNTELRAARPGKEPTALDWWGSIPVLLARGLIRPDAIREKLRRREYVFVACRKDYFDWLLGSPQALIESEFLRYYRPDGEEKDPAGIRHFYFFVPRETPLPDDPSAERRTRSDEIDREPAP